jgi:hypothetical protein
MMRSASVSEHKGKSTQRTQRIPREGTQLRALYDLFVANKGRVVDVSPTMRGGRALSDLTDYYEMDIRKLGHRRWVLAGEWFGPDYVDYIAAVLENHDAASSPEATL